MKCPLTISSRYITGPDTVIVGADCLLTKCAWYHPTTLSCDIDRIASCLSTIANALADIAEKMPHVEQFKK